MKKRNLIIAFLTMGVAFSATSLSFSFAWYASSTQLRVDDINVHIDGDRLLRLSTAKDGEYKETLTDVELDEVGLFTPVSSCFQSSWDHQVKPSFFDMSRNMWDLHGVPYRYQLENEGFFCQELYIQADDDVYVTLDPELCTFVHDGTKNAAYAERLAKEEGHFTAGEYLERLNGVERCGRMSVLVDGEYLIFDPSNNEKEVVFAGVLDNDNDVYYDYYQDPDNGEFYEVCYGEVLDRSKLVYLDPVDEDSLLEGEPTAFNARHAAGVHILDFEASKEAFAHEQRHFGEEFTPYDAPLIFELDAFTPKRIVVSFYLEGWDKDSINGAMGASFDVAMSFKIFRER